MAKIKGIENMSGTEISPDLQKGARFVVNEYAISAMRQSAQLTQEYEMGITLGFILIWPLYYRFCD